MEIRLYDDNGEILFQTEYTFNACILKGRLGEINEYDNVIKTSLMISQGKDKSGEWKPSAFINIIDFDKKLTGYKKGDTLYGVFKYSQHKYTDKEGNTRTSTDFVLLSTIGSTNKAEYSSGSTVESPVFDL